MPVEETEKLPGRVPTSFSVLSHMPPAGGLETGSSVQVPARQLPTEQVPGEDSQVLRSLLAWLTQPTPGWHESEVQRLPSSQLLTASSHMPVLGLQV